MTFLPYIAPMRPPAAVGGDLLDSFSLLDAVEESQPDEVYNLGAQSFFTESWPETVFTGDVDALGVARLLKAIRRVKPDARFYQVASSEMLGKVAEIPQSEKTQFHPRSPYGVAKVWPRPGKWCNFRVILRPSV